MIEPSEVWVEDYETKMLSLISNGTLKYIDKVTPISSFGYNHRFIGPTTYLEVGTDYKSFWTRTAPITKLLGEAINWGEKEIINDEFFTKIESMIGLAEATKMKVPVNNTNTIWDETNGKWTFVADNPKKTIQYKDEFGKWHDVKDLNGDSMYVDQWAEAKQRGSQHYKTGKVEPIDLYRSAKPHESYNAFDIKALTDVIKYAFRLLTRGYMASDVDKIIHYMELYRADMEGR